MSVILSLYNTSSLNPRISGLLTSLATAGKIITKQIQKLPHLRGWLPLAPISRQGKEGERREDLRNKMRGKWKLKLCVRYITADRTYLWQSVILKGPHIHELKVEGRYWIKVGQTANDNDFTFLSKLTGK